MLRSSSLSEDDAIALAKAEIKHLSGVLSKEFSVRVIGAISTNHVYLSREGSVVGLLRADLTIQNREVVGMTLLVERGEIPEGLEEEIILRGWIPDFDSDKQEYTMTFKDDPKVSKLAAIDESLMNKYIDELWSKVDDNTQIEDLLQIMEQMGIPEEYQERIASDLGMTLPAKPEPEPTPKPESGKPLKLVLTPVMWDLLKRIEKDGFITKLKIMDIKYASKTAKALESKELIKQEYVKDAKGQTVSAYVLTERGKVLCGRTPRWSGTTRDKYNNLIQVWNMYDLGDSFSDFSPDKNRQKPDDQFDLGDEHDSSNFFAEPKMRSSLLNRG